MAKDVREPAKEKDAGKEMTAAPAPDIDGAPPVQDAEVSVSAADVEGCGQGRSQEFAQGVSRLQLT